MAVMNVMIILIKYNDDGVDDDHDDHIDCIQ